MTPRERTEKVMTRLLSGEMCKCHGDLALIGCNASTAAAIEEAIRDARREAFEEAAKVADEYGKRTGSWMVDGACIDIASDIRALATSPREGES